MSRRSISIVVPALNEEECLVELHPAVVSAMAPTGYDWELIIVDDGSTDRTAEVIAAILKEEIESHLGAGNAVVEGRDIGTVVFPAAPVKVFLTADAATRAARRIGRSWAFTRSPSPSTRGAATRRSWATW